MKTIVVIPARLNSSRLPNKVLLDLKGKTVVQRVYEQALKAGNIDQVYIATDSQKVFKSCQKFTQNIILTETKHESGTDRIAEAVSQIDCDHVINVQGDEPFIAAQLIEQVANALDGHRVKMSSAMHRIEQVSDLKNPNIVKVTVSNNKEALYFSRSIIPHHRDEWESLLNHHTHIPNALNFYRHLGIYGYSKNFLIEFSKMQPTYLERLEKLEQLRALESGFSIQMIETSHHSIGIDTWDDYEQAKRLLSV
jgi:3-deoxy-manno-octulosonate cytidylyltransferase (CMP-KDO synthetase)